MFRHKLQRVMCQVEVLFGVRCRSDIRTPLGRWGLSPQQVDSQLTRVVYNDYCIGPPRFSKTAYATSVATGHADTHD